MTYVHTSARGVGLTSLGDFWEGQRRPHIHYVHVMQDEDSDIVGLYPLDKQQYLEKYIPFIGEPTALYLLK